MDGHIHCFTRLAFTSVPGSRSFTSVRAALMSSCKRDSENPLLDPFVSSNAVLTLSWIFGCLVSNQRATCTSEMGFLKGRTSQTQIPPRAPPTIAPNMIQRTITGRDGSTRSAAMAMRSPPRTMVITAAKPRNSCI